MNFSFFPVVGMMIQSGFHIFQGGEPPISIDHIRLGNGVFHQLATLGPTDKVVIDRGFWQQFLWACNYNNEYSYRIRKLMIYIYTYTNYDNEYMTICVCI
jgi:hypothetical protein